MTLEELKVVISAETSGLQKELKSIQSQLDKTDKSVSKSTGSIKKAFSSLTKGIAFTAIIHQLTKLGKQAIETASDLQEVQNVVEVSFGSMTAEVDKFAESAIKKFGLSELSAKQFASTFMAMSNGMGIAAEAGKNMSLNLTALSADMASFYNVQQDEAFTALKSVFTGETESLKRFGIVMTEANLSAYAMSQGISKSYSEMSQAERVALRYSFVLNATKNAQGDFARTSGSWANQVRILKEQFSELAGIIGNGLIKVLTPVITLFNKLLSLAIGLANAIATVFGGKKIKDSSTSVSNMASGMNNVASGAQDTSTGLDNANKSANKLKRTLAGFDQLNVLSDPNSASGSGGSGASGGSGGGAITGLANTSYIEDTEETKSTPFDHIADKIQPQIKKLKKAIKDLKKSFKDFIDSEVVQTAMDLLGDFAGAFVMDTITSGIDVLSGTIEGLSEQLSMYTHILDAVAKLMRGDFKGAFEDSKLAVGDLGDYVFDLSYVFDSMPEWIKKPFGIALESVENFVDTVALIISVDWAKVWKDFKDTVSKKFTDVKNYISTSFDSIKTKAGDAVSGIKTAFKNIPDWFKTKFNSIKTKAKDAMSGIKDAFKGIPEWFRTTFTKAWTNVKKVFSKGGKVFTGIKDGILSGLKSVINALIGGINKVIAIPFNGINAALRKIKNISILGKKPFYGLIGNIAVPHIPKLAKGGIITAPTIAMMGEYPGASRNPEIVAPQSLLKETLSDSNNDLIEALFTVTARLIKAINDSNVVIEGDAKGMFKAIKREADNYTYRTGKPAFI